MSRRRSVLGAVVASVVVHLGFAVAVYCAPVPPPYTYDEPERVEVVTFDRDVELPRPELIEREVPDEIEIPELEPEPLPVLEKIEPVAEPKPKPAPKTPPRVRKRKPRKRPVKRKAPVRKTVVIQTAITGAGGPKVYGGDEDTFGDAKVERTEETAAPDDRPRGKGPKDSTGDGLGTAPAAPARPPKVVPPRVRQKVKGVYPADAPRTGRPIVITLSLRVDKTGKVASARIVLKPSNAGKFFDKEAKRVAKRTRFRPATSDGKPIPYTIRYQVVFTP